MYANTLTLTISTVARTLIRVNQDNYGSEYKYSDAVEQIIMKIRHSTDNRKGIPVNRHNVTVEHTIFATPTVSEKYFSMTVTLRDQLGSGPAGLLADWQGFNALLLTLDDTLVAGEN